MILFICTNSKLNSKYKSKIYCKYYKEEEKILHSRVFKDEITKTIEDNNSKLQLIDKKERWHKKCLCLVEFNNIESIEPLDFDHQGNMDDWLIIEK